MFCNTWQLGGPSLQPALEKLLGTWVGVFPQPVLNDVHARLAQMRAAVPLQQQQQQQPNGYGGPFASYGGQPMDQYAQQQPMRMMQDPRLAPGGQYPQLPPQQQPMYGMQQQQQAPPYYGPPGQAPVAQPSPGYGAPYSTLPPQQPAPAYGYAHQAPGQPQPLYPQPQQAYSQTVQGGALAAGAGLQQQQLPDLLSSLVNAGLLLSTAALGAAAVVQPAGSLPTTPPHAVTASPTPEQSSLEFTPDRIKVQDLRTQLFAPLCPGWRQLFLLYYSLAHRVCAAAQSHRFMFHGSVSSPAAQLGCRWVPCQRMLTTILRPCPANQCSARALCALLWPSY